MCICVSYVDMHGIHMQVDAIISESNGFGYHGFHDRNLFE